MFKSRITLHYFPATSLYKDLSSYLSLLHYHNCEAINLDRGCDMMLTKTEVIC